MKISVGSCRLFIMSKPNEGILVSKSFWRKLSQICRIEVSKMGFSILKRKEFIGVSTLNNL